MTQLHNFDHIDQLLRDETVADAEDRLYVQLMRAAPRPREAFVESLEGQFEKEKPTRSVPRSLQLAAALVAACLLLVGTVFAIDDLLNRVLDSDAGLQAVREEGRGVDLNLSAETEQFTVEIQWGYVDPQRISLGYVVRAHDAQTYTNIDIVDAVLTLTDGQQIPLQSPGLHLIENNQTAGRLEANASDIRLSDELNAQLSFRLAYAHDDHRTAVPLPESGSSTMQLEDWMLRTPPVTLDLNLPVENGYTIQLDLTAEDAGIEMHLREFRAAPSLGHALVCFTPPQRPQEEAWEWDVLNITLQYNGEPIVTWADGRYIDGCSEIRFAEGLPLEPGTWTLTIREISGVRTQLPDGPECEATVTAAGGEVYTIEGGMRGLLLPEGADQMIGLRERISGEWTFTFDGP